MCLLAYLCGPFSLSLYVIYRFVTGLVDNKLHGAKKSMFSRALDLGLPASFVELRHEATHRELPSLTVLRDSTGRSLEWLWGFYWRGVGVDSFSSGSGGGELEELVRGVLGQVVALVDATADGKGVGSGDGLSRKKRRVQMDVASVAARVVGILKESRGAESALVRVMLREGWFVPAGRR